MAKTHDTFDKNTNRGPLGASWGPLEGLLGASRLEGLLNASWGFFGSLSKSVVSLLFLDPEANFHCKNTMILLILRSWEVADGRVNKMSECP